LSETGYVVEEPETPSIEAAAVLWARLGAADSRSLGWPTMEKLADDGVKRVNSFFIQASPALDLPGYQRALAQLTAHRPAGGLFLERCPIVLGPNSGDLAFEIGFDSRDQEAMSHQLRMQALMVAVNLLGLPAVAVPTGSIATADAPHGLPLGVQLIAGRFREDLALEAAEAIERKLGLETPIDPVRAPA